MALTVGRVMSCIDMARDIREDIEDIWDDKNKLENLDLNVIYEMCHQYEEHLKNLEIKQ